MDVFASETIRSRCHVHAQSYVKNPVTIFLGPKIQGIASQQVKNLSEKDKI